MRVVVDEGRECSMCFDQFSRLVELNSGATICDECTDLAVALVGASAAEESRSAWRSFQRERWRWIDMDDFERRLDVPPAHQPCPECGAQDTLQVNPSYDGSDHALFICATCVSNVANAIGADNSVEPGDEPEA